MANIAGSPKKLTGSTIQSIHLIVFPAFPYLVYTLSGYPKDVTYRLVGVTISPEFQHCLLALRGFLLEGSCHNGDIIAHWYVTVKPSFTSGITLDKYIKIVYA